jgi:hypothetical protein
MISKSTGTNRQDAKNAKSTRRRMKNSSFSSWRSWRLGGFETGFNSWAQ